MNILIFGPNGSGKGTQAYFLQKHFHLEHLETGQIFRHNIANNTPLGEKVKAILKEGSLVPDSITTPMMIDAIQNIPPQKGWLLDGYPRNRTQAISLINALQEVSMHVDCIIELVLDRMIAKQRLLGRRLCSQDNAHSNNIYISEIVPREEGICRVCSAPLSVRSDDTDEKSIDTRHDIYYDNENGTMAAIDYCKQHLVIEGNTRYISINTDQDITTINQQLFEQLS